MQESTMNTTRGKLFVVTGPSGAGKDSVLARTKELGLDAGSVITTSTRAMRPGESERHPYYFVTQEEFEKKIDQKEMIEWAEVYGNYYGSTRAEVERVLAENPVVIVKVDPQGARTFKEMMPEATTIFIAPPSVEFLKKRLEGRATDSPEVIAKRLAIASSEMEHLETWDHVIRNEEGKLDDAANEFLQIIQNASAV